MVALGHETFAPGAGFADDHERVGRRVGNLRVGGLAISQ